MATVGFYKNALPRAGYTRYSNIDFNTITTVGTYYISTDTTTGSSTNYPVDTLGAINYNEGLLEVFSAEDYDAQSVPIYGLHIVQRFTSNSSNTVPQKVFIREYVDTMTTDFWSNWRDISASNQYTELTSATDVNTLFVGGQYYLYGTGNTNLPKRTINGVTTTATEGFLEVFCSEEVNANATANHVIQRFTSYALAPDTNYSDAASVDDDYQYTYTREYCGHAKFGNWSDWVPLRTESYFVNTTQTIYLAPTTAANSTTGVIGSDFTGDGTASKPYATVTKAMTEFNKRRASGKIAYIIYCLPGIYDMGISTVAIAHPDVSAETNSLTLQSTTCDPADVTFLWTEDPTTYYDGGRTYLCVYCHLYVRGITFKIAERSNYNHSLIGCYYAIGCYIANCRFENIGTAIQTNTELCSYVHDTSFNNGTYGIVNNEGTLACWNIEFTDYNLAILCREGTALSLRKNTEWGDSDSARHYFLFNNCTIAIREHAPGNTYPAIDTTTAVVYDEYGRYINYGTTVAANRKQIVPPDIIHKSTNGYYKPTKSTFIMQWGTTAESGNEDPVTTVFPITFPNACLQVLISTNNCVSDVDDYNNLDAVGQVLSTSTTGFTWMRQNSYDMGGSMKLSCSFIAIGY